MRHTLSVALSAAALAVAIGSRPPAPSPVQPQPAAVQPQPIAWQPQPPAWQPQPIAWQPQPPGPIVRAVGAVAELADRAAARIIPLR